MYKLLLADDNEFVLKGFREKINLGKLGIELAGIARNGLEALDLIREINPDILVTDIKMPKMTGMELIEAIRKTKNRTKVVILSGYSDFEYARKAISLNAVEYLLKPIPKGDIEATLARIVESLKAEESEALRKNRLENRSRQSAEMARTHVIGALLEGRAENTGWIRDYLAADNENLLNAKAAVVLMELDPPESAANPRSEARTDAPTILQTALSAAGEGCIGLTLGDGRAAILLAYDRSVKDAQIAENCLKTMRSVCSAINGRHGLTASVSAGMAVPDIFDIGKSYAQASEAMRFRLISGCNSVIPYAEAIKSESASVRFSESVKKALGAAANGEGESVAAAVDELYGGVAANKDCNPTVLIEASYKLALAARKIALNGGSPSSEAVLWEQLNGMDSLESIRGWIRKLFNEAFQAAEGKNRYSQTIRFVIGAIEKNYSKELLLKNIARDLYMSENYLTTLFKKETGISFKKFITDFRLHKAVELLQDPKYKVYEIAGLVGYDSEEHFCRIFKETLGLTPKEYRNNGKHGPSGFQQP